MEDIKFRLLKETVIEFEGHKLYRIEALRSFGTVRKGELGGYVETEDNLSHQGSCWVYNNAKVYDYAKVYDDSTIRHEAQIYGHAKVYGQACVNGNAQVYGHAKVYGEARVCNIAHVHLKAKVYDKAVITHSANIYGEAQVYGEALINDVVEISGKAKVYGNTAVEGIAQITGNAEISQNGDYYVGKNIWSSGRYFTYTRPNGFWKVGCFLGTSKELIQKAYEDDLVTGREYERIVNYVESMYNDLEND